MINLIKGDAIWGWPGPSMDPFMWEVCRAYHHVPAARKVYQCQVIVVAVIMKTIASSSPPMHFFVADFRVKIT